MPSKVQLWGLVEYKPQWSITIQGWLFIGVLLLSLIGVILTQIQPFLAYNTPLKQADALIVEGWVPDNVIAKAMEEFQRGNYRVLITTGLPISRGSYLSKYNNFAEIAAATLIALGLEEDKIKVIPAPEVEKDRTAASAMAVYDWIENSDLKIASINLYSYDVHTRRSWIIFKETLEPNIKVGAIAEPSKDYDPKQWWKYSNGARAMISETIGYVYVKLKDWNN